MGQNGNPEKKIRSRSSRYATEEDVTRAPAWSAASYRYTAPSFVWQHNGTWSCSGQALAGAAGFGRLPWTSTTAGTWFPSFLFHRRHYTLCFYFRVRWSPRLFTNIRRLCPVEMCRVGWIFHCGIIPWKLHILYHFGEYAGTQRPR